MTALARTFSDRKNINHRINVQVFRAPKDPLGLDDLEQRAKPYLRDLQSVIQSRTLSLTGNLFYVDMRGVVSGRPDHSLRWKRETLLRYARSARSILDIGLNAGHSTLLCLLANPEAKITALDLPDHACARKCADYLRSAFPGRVTFVEGDSRTVLPQLDAGEFDLIHFDGGKDKTISADLDAARRLVADDHILVIDDTQNARLNDIVVEQENRGDLVTSPFRDANQRACRSRWTHKIARFKPLADAPERILDRLGRIYRDTDHASIFTRADDNGQVLGVNRAAALIRAVRAAEADRVPGAIVEVGIAAGHSTVIAALATSRFLPRDFFLYDTFRGISEVPNEKDLHGRSLRDYDLSRYRAPECDAGPVRAKLLEAGLAENRIFMVEGLAEIMIPQIAPDSIAVLRLDVNLYQPTRVALEQLYDVIAPKGWLIVADYGHWHGCQAAVDGFFSDRGKTFDATAVDYSCYIMQKP